MMIPPLKVPLDHTHYEGCPCPPNEYSYVRDGSWERYAAVRALAQLDGLDHDLNLSTPTGGMIAGIPKDWVMVPSVRNQINWYIRAIRAEVIILTDRIKELEKK